MSSTTKYNQGRDTLWPKGDKTSPPHDRVLLALLLLLLL